MCMKKEDLIKLGTKPLLDNFKRAIELDTKDAGNGKNPFDQKELYGEILRRLRQYKKAQLLFSSTSI